MINVWVTSPSVYASRVCQALSEQGFHAISEPLIETDTHSRLSTVRRLIQCESRYDILAFTSRSAIKAYHAVASESEHYPQTDCCAIGKDNELLAQLLKVQPVIQSVPLSSSATAVEASPMGIVQYLSKNTTYTRKTIAVLAPHVEQISEPDTVPDFLNALKGIGWETDRYDVYTTLMLQPSPSFVSSFVHPDNDSMASSKDILLFTSGVEVESFMTFASDAMKQRITSGDVKVCFMGKYTASYAAKLGMKIDFVPTSFHSFREVAAQMKAFFKTC